MADNAVTRLKVIRAEVERRTRERDKLEGRKEQLLKQLKDDFDLDTVEEARAEADRMESELTDIDAKLEEQVSSMEKQLGEKE